tara:strand:+ start:161 stop:454 length:294 start_codon:yes stop_codon:yes gene_type:complete
MDELLDLITDLVELQPCASCGGAGKSRRDLSEEEQDALRESLGTSVESVTESCSVCAGQGTAPREAESKEAVLGGLAQAIVVWARAMGYLPPEDAVH